MTVKDKILQGRTYLGIELGSTRIKAVLIDDSFSVIASGSKQWENGCWTYSLDDIHGGIQACYKDLAENVKAQYGIYPETYGAMGISAMMHGYMAFDKNDKLLVPFRTWRNTMTAQAAGELTKLLGFNIPQRWSIRRCLTKKPMFLISLISIPLQAMCIKGSQTALKLALAKLQVSSLWRA